MIRLPDHKCSLTITHNPHKDYRETVSEYLGTCGSIDWADDEAKQRAIDTDEIWTIQWYPDTPIGSYTVAAPTLQEALDLANSNN